MYNNVLKKRIKQYINPDYLVIDDTGHKRLELEVVKETHLLFKVIDQRYNDNKPLIFNTNIEEEEWPDSLGDKFADTALLDRIFHHSVIVKMV